MRASGPLDERWRCDPLSSKPSGAEQRNTGKHPVEEFTPLHMGHKYIGCCGRFQPG
jgi:hypothetical protein